MEKKLLNIKKLVLSLAIPKSSKKVIVNEIIDLEIYDSSKKFLDDVITIQELQDFTKMLYNQRLALKYDNIKIKAKNNKK